MLRTVVFLMLQYGTLLIDVFLRQSSRPQRVSTRLLSRQYVKSAAGINGANSTLAQSWDEGKWLKKIFFGPISRSVLLNSCLCYSQLQAGHSNG